LLCAHVGIECPGTCTRLGLLKPVENLNLLQPHGDSEDEDKYADDVDMPGQKFETKQRITVRNLRIREDTAKVSSPDTFNYLSLL
jgi:hypothetical protein